MNGTEQKQTKVVRKSSVRDQIGYFSKPTTSTKCLYPWIRIFYHRADRNFVIFILVNTREIFEGNSRYFIFV